MKLRAFIVLTVIIKVFGLCGLLFADATVFRVTINSHEDCYPMIKDDYLVWQGYDGGDWEVFLFNAATGETIQITENDNDDLSPRTDGTYVVWHGFKDNEWDVFLWDGIGTRVISDAGAEDVSPQIARGVVVWSSAPFGDGFLGPGDIVLYEASNQRTTILSAAVDPNNVMDDSAPKINREFVYWTQSDEQGEATAYVYDIATGDITTETGDVWKDTYRADGDLSVVTRHDGKDWEIFLYNTDSKRHHQVTGNRLQDRDPVISGNRVAWMAGGEIFLAECKYLDLIRPEDGAELPRKPAPTFVWEAIGYPACQIQFSTDPDFSTRATLTFPAYGTRWLSGTSFTPTSRQWRLISWLSRRNGQLFWRVKAKDEDGNLSYSEARGFSIEEIRNTSPRGSRRRTRP